MKSATRWLPMLLAGLLLVVTACTSSSMGPPEVQGSPAMIDAAGKPTLWVLTKREETRQVSVGGGGTHNSATWRSDTFFHFDVQALDPVTTQPLWTRRLLTLGDPEAKGPEPSRVIGSAANARLIGQEGERVWMFLDDKLLALNAADGSQLADVAAIEQRNPELKGLLPREDDRYTFDGGLVFMSADARHFVLRGPALKAEPYAPAPTIVAEPAPRAGGARLVVPTPPFGEVPARQVRLSGQWLGLYSDKEAADAGNDEFGDRLRYPYTVLDEGSQARREFWRARIVSTQRFDDVYDRLDGLTPIPGSPVFLRGRFLKNFATGQPRVLENPKGVAVWHVTRIDGDGHLALTRLGAELRPIWIATLPLSDNSMANPVMVWPLGERLVVFGGEESVVDGVSRREPRLVSIALADGSWKARNMTAETAIR